MQVNERQVRFQPIEILIENQNELDCMVALLAEAKQSYSRGIGIIIEKQLKFIKELEDKLPVF